MGNTQTLIMEINVCITVGLRNSLIQMLAHVGNVLRDLMEWAKMADILICNVTGADKTITITWIHTNASHAQKME